MLLIAKLMGLLDERISSEVPSVCPIIRIFLQTALDKVSEFLRYRRPALEGWCRVVVYQILDFDGAISTGVRMLTSGHLVYDNAQRPDIAWVRVVKIGEALRGHVAQRACIGPRRLSRVAVFST